jgi:serine/threonine-protein kinase
MEHSTQSARAGEQGTAPDLTGRTLGDFLILRRLGQGGMGQVYLAQQLSLKRKIALKLLRPEVAANATSLQRFKMEAEAVARVTHANIVQVYAIGEHDGIHYMALEYVEGRNLKEYVARKGPPEVPVALSIMRQVAAALQRASESGIIHRDIKPENILLNRKGEVKVADFGLSRVLAENQQPLNLTQSGVVMGTPLYMSPEQVQGHPVDARTDIYSLGVTSYHLLAGQPPYTGTNPFDVAMKHVQGEPAPLASIRPDLPAELCAVVHKMMARSPADRYQTGKDLIRDLARLRDSLAGGPGVPYTQGLPVAAITVVAPLVTGGSPTGTAVPARASGSTTALPAPPPRWTRPVWLLVASLVLAAVAGGGLAWWQRQHAGTPPAAPGSADSDNGAVDALFSLSKREQFLKEALEVYAHPNAQDATQVRNGVGHFLELGLFYLENGRLDEAEQLFRRLENMKDVRDYHVLGRLGRAVALGLQNQTEGSNRLFREVIGERQFLVLLQLNPQLREQMGKAIEYNLTNAPQTFPPELVRALQAPPLRGLVPIPPSLLARVPVKP